MGCKSCSERRARAKEALANKNFRQAGREIVSGAAAMTGLIPKDAMPGPSGRRK